MHSASALVVLPLRFNFFGPLACTLLVLTDLVVYCERWGFYLLDRNLSPQPMRKADYQGPPEDGNNAAPNPASRCESLQQPLKELVRTTGFALHVVKNAELHKLLRLPCVFALAHATGGRGGEGGLCMHAC